MTLTGHQKAVRVAVLRRSWGRCEVTGCAEPAVRVHHRKLRSQGGEDTLANLLHVCSRCHGEIHAHPADSYRAGWLVPSWADPEDWPQQGWTFEDAVADTRGEAPLDRPLEEVDPW